MRLGTILENSYKILISTRDYSGSREKIRMGCTVGTGTFYKVIEMLLKAGYLNETLIGRIRWTCITSSGMKFIDNIETIKANLGLNE